MIPIQIITLETEARFIRVMIEKIGSSKYRAYVSTRTNISEDCYSSFIVYPSMEEENSKIFNSAQDALSDVSSKYAHSIIKVQNQRSDLLTSDDIKRITCCTNIEEV